MELTVTQQENDTESEEIPKEQAGTELDALQDIGTSEAAAVQYTIVIDAGHQQKSDPQLEPIGPGQMRKSPKWQVVRVDAPAD